VDDPAERLRVLMVTNNWIYGGRERVVTSLCEGFRDFLGWDVTLLIARRREIGLAASAERFPEPRGIPVRWLETDRLRGIVLRLGRIMRQLKPDVIFWHAHIGVFPYYWLASVIAGNSSRIVAVYHGTDTSVRSRLGGRLSSMIARLVPVSVAVSEGTASVVRTHFRLRPDTVHIVYNSIDALATRATAQGHEPEELAGRHPVVLVAARLSAEKDWRTLIEAFAIVAAATHANLCIVGEGEERERIVGLARDAGIAARVVLAGNQQNPYRFMSNADVFVLCSHNEGFGMVLLEAMACGVPVVATDCEAGPREIITHGQNGLLVRPEDSAALAEATLSILADTELAQHLRQGGLERADEFSLDDAVEAYREIAENVCSRYQQGRGPSGDQDHA
jgi:glycosyltransferase involved in cell wall biosynthesis